MSSILEMRPIIVLIFFIHFQSDVNSFDICEEFARNGYQIDYGLEVPITKDYSHYWLVINNRQNSRPMSWQIQNSSDEGIYHLTNPGTEPTLLYNLTIDKTYDQSITLGNQSVLSNILFYSRNSQQFDAFVKTQHLKQWIQSSVSFPEEADFHYNYPSVWYRIFGDFTTFEVVKQRKVGDVFSRLPPNGYYYLSNTMYKSKYYNPKSVIDPLDHLMAVNAVFVVGVNKYLIVSNYSNRLKYCYSDPQIFHINCKTDELKDLFDCSQKSESVTTTTSPSSSSTSSTPSSQKTESVHSESDISTTISETTTKTTPIRGITFGTEGTVAQTTEKPSFPLYLVFILVVFIVFSILFLIGGVLIIYWFVSKEKTKRDKIRTIKKNIELKRIKESLGQEEDTESESPDASGTVRTSTERDETNSEKIDKSQVQ